MKHTKVTITAAYELWTKEQLRLMIAELVLPLAGGVTFTEGFGVWEDNAGKKVWDTVIVTTCVVEVYLAEEWKRVAETLSKKLQQECVCVETQEVDFKLVYR